MEEVGKGLDFVMGYSEMMQQQFLLLLLIVVGGKHEGGGYGMAAGGQVTAMGQTHAGS